MDIKKCQLFVITAETKNISKTAELTGYTQSAVSHTLKKFEREIGIPLFQRDRYGVRLTPVGKEFLPYVRALVNENEKVEQFVYDLKGLEIGTLTIGTYKSMSISYLPDILNQFKMYHPNIQFQIKEGGATEIEHWLSESIIDVGFLSKQPSTHYDFFSIMVDEFLAILPANSPLTEFDSIPLELFNGIPYIQSEVGVDSDIQPLLDKYKVKPLIQYSAMDDCTILSMVSHQMGVSILPKLTIDWFPNNCEVRSLDPALHRILGMIVNDYKNAAPLTKSFIQFVKHYFENK